MGRELFTESLKLISKAVVVAMFAITFFSCSDDNEDVIGIVETQSGRSVRSLDNSGEDELPPNPDFQTAFGDNVGFISERNKIITIGGVIYTP